MNDTQPNPSEATAAPNPTAAYLVTAIIFFLLGFLIAGALGFDLFTVAGDSVADAVQATLIALTPPPTATPTAVPIPMTFSERDYVIGAEDAPITLVEFSDYQCPYCGQWGLGTLPALMEKYDGYVRFVYRDFPIFGDDSIKAAHAAACADQQDAFLPYHDLIFTSQNGRMPIVDANLIQLASQLELDTAAFESCLANTRFSQDIYQNYIDGIALLGNAPTPTFLLNGKRLTGALPLDHLSALIDQELLALGIEPPPS